MTPERTALQQQCAALESSLFDAFKIAATTLSGIPDSELLTNTSTQFFLARLKPTDSRYKQLAVYIYSSLGDQLQTTNEFEKILASDSPFPETEDDSEIAALFRSPKKVMGDFFNNLDHFGLTAYHEFYNFDEQLKLLFKLQLLNGACLHESFPDEWIKKQHALLQTQITNFATDAQDITKLLPLLNSRPQNNSTISPQVPLEDEERPNSNTPLSQPRSKLRNILSKIGYVLFGDELLQFLTRFFIRLIASPFVLFYLLRTDYREGYSLKKSAVTLAGVYAIITALAVELPVTLLKSILGFPFRLASVIINLIAKEDSPTRIKAQRFLTKAINVLNKTINYTIRVALYAFVTGYALLAGTAIGFILYPLVSIFVRGVIKPIVTKLTKSSSSLPDNNQMPPLISQLFKLQLTMQQTLMSSPGHNKIMIGANSITLTELTQRIQALRSNREFSGLHWLDKLLLEERSIIINFNNEDNTSRTSHIIICKKEVQPKDLDEYLLNENIESITIDWRHYNHQRLPSLDNIEHITSALAKRTAPLKNLSFITNNMDDVAAKKLADALIKNETLQLESISIASNKFTHAAYDSLLALVKAKPSIKYIPSLPTDSHDLEPDLRKTCREIRCILAEHRGEKEIVPANTSTGAPNRPRQQSTEILHDERAYIRALTSHI